MSPNAIAIIPARGGSKRLPRKNILDFKSKPLIAWTIEAALRSKLFDKVLVSTDDNEISNISKKYGADVPFLRNKAADDITPISEATIVALKQAEEFWGGKFNIICQLMANCPLRDQDNIKTSFNAFINSKKPSQISCFKFGWMMPWWSLKLNKDGEGEQLFPEACKKRSQDLPPLYCPTGAIWIAKRDSLLKNNSFYMPGTRYEPINWISAVDIDEYDDFKMAELCFNLKNKDQ
tara:strand:- start:158 stop:862 length:705 start_codon:yes stop_codon:yes gene_type:complete